MEQPPVTRSADFGRVDADGTVYVRTHEGERVVGSWLAGSPEEGLAYFVRKYEDLEAEVAILEKRVEADPGRAAGSAARLRTELETAAVVGDLAALDARLVTITDAAAARQSEVAEQRAAARAESRSRRRWSPKPRSSPPATTGVTPTSRCGRWSTAGRALGRLDRKTDDALWTRLAAARSTVQRRRRVHFAELEDKRKQAQVRKTELVAEAEKLAESTSWGPTSARFRDLMNEWKAAGGAPKAAEAELWGRFRAAQDAFFAARSASRAERDAGVKLPLAAREELVVEAEALDPKSDPPEPASGCATSRGAGTRPPAVPRDVLDLLDRRLGAVEDKLRDVEQARFKPDPTDNPLVIRLNESIAKLERRIERAEQAGDQRAVEEAQAALKRSAAGSPKPPVS